jgi:hypothetical protein
MVQIVTDVTKFNRNTRRPLLIIGMIKKNITEVVKQATTNGCVGR